MRVVIVGEGPERPRLEELVRRLGVEERVLLVGARDDVPDLLAAFDVAVCCSDFEGGPLSVMEYMAAGLPVVASDVGGLPELIADGESGVLVRARDPSALAEAVSGLLRDGPLRARIGAAARERIRASYGIDAWTGRLQALYSDLLAVRGA